MAWSGLLLASMGGRTWIVIGDFCGMRLSVYAVGGMCHSVFEGILIQLSSVGRLRVTSLNPAMTRFFEFIFDLDLLDIPLAGGVFTWSHNRAWSRVD